MIAWKLKVGIFWEVFEGLQTDRALIHFACESCHSTAHFEAPPSCAFDEKTSGGRFFINKKK